MMMSCEKQLSKTAIPNLVGDKPVSLPASFWSCLAGWRHRISASMVANLEREPFVREVASNGVPRLILTDEGKRLIAGGGE